MLDVLDGARGMPRLSDYCANNCGNLKNPMHSFMVGARRYDHCSNGCMQSKLSQLQCVEALP